jgi:hypothetical protein
LLDESELLCEQVLAAHGLGARRGYGPQSEGAVEGSTLPIYQDHGSERSRFHFGNATQVDVDMSDTFMQSGSHDSPHLIDGPRIQWAADRHL